MVFKMVNRQIIVTWLLLATEGHWCDGSCAIGEFATANSICCPSCEPGWFVRTNCTKAGNRKTGTECEKCTVCGNGQRKVSDCTSFSNTVCENQALNLTTPVTVAMTPRLTEPQPVSVIYTVSLYVVSSVVLLLILVAVVWKWRSAHRPSTDPAREPFNIQELKV